MFNVNEVIKKLETLYDYGEVSYTETVKYLCDLNFIRLIEDKLVITKKWIKFSGGVNREDFISSLLCYNPVVFNYLLLKVYKEACFIGEKKDSEPLFEFINIIPKFAEIILQIKNENLVETEEIKAICQFIFKGYPSYLSILSKLKLMQLAEEIKESEPEAIGVNPNENWRLGRKITSSVSLEMKNDKNKYTLVPYEYLDYNVEDKVKEVLSYPWKTFVVILSLVIGEYKAEEIEAASIRPTDYFNPYNKQKLDFYILNYKGKETNIGSLNDFIYEFCMENDLCLFPDKVPQVDNVVFELLEQKLFQFKDNEYVISDSFNDLIYSKDRILKNRSRNFKSILKEYIEGLRKAL